MSYLTRALGAARLALSANAPTLMVVGGVVAMGTGTVLACSKTLELEDVLEKHLPTLEEIQKGEDNPALVEYTTEKARADRIKIYARVSRDVTKLYAVPGTLFVAGAALVFGGHRIMLKRNATLALAYTGLKKSFDAYRERVRREFGSMVDQGMLSGHTTKEVGDEEGNMQEVATRDWDQTGTGDPYNRVFEQGATKEWQNDLSINRMFLHNQQKFAQHLLGQRGYLYLSEVYQSLGFPESDISRVVGWKVRRLPDGTRDIPMVDFGLDSPHPDDWKFSKENAIYLDFNCQGLIVGGKVQKILEKA